MELKRVLLATFHPESPKIPDLGITAGFYENGEIINLKFS